MTEPYVFVATEKLHVHADYVREAQGRIWDIRHKVETGAIPVTAWGVPNAASTPDHTMPSGWDYEGHPSEALRMAKEAYEEAQTATLGRLYDLANIYAETARGLDTVADNYDLTDMREPRSRYRQEPR